MFLVCLFYAWIHVRFLEILLAIYVEISSMLYVINLYLYLIFIRREKKSIFCPNLTNHCPQTHRVTKFNFLTFQDFLQLEDNLQLSTQDSCLNTCKTSENKHQFKNWYRLDATARKKGLRRYFFVTIQPDFSKEESW